MLIIPTALFTLPSFNECQVSRSSHRDFHPPRTHQSLRPASSAPGAKRVARQTACTAEPSRQHSSRSSGSGVQDAQETELAAADQQAKQDLYAQLLERQHSGSSVNVSTSSPVDTAQPQTRPAEKGSTELIFRLERRGEGWGEEIFPHLVVEQRPWTSVAKRDRNRSSRPKPWTVLPSLAQAIVGAVDKAASDVYVHACL